MLKRLRWRPWPSHRLTSAASLMGTPGCAVVSAEELLSQVIQQHLLARGVHKVQGQNFAFWLMLISGPIHLQSGKSSILAALLRRPHPVKIPEKIGLTRPSTHRSGKIGKVSCIEIGNSLISLAFFRRWLLRILASTRGTCEELDVLGCHH